MYSIISIIFFLTFLLGIPEFMNVGGILKLKTNEETIGNYVTSSIFMSYTSYIPIDCHWQSTLLHSEMAQFWFNLVEAVKTNLPHSFMWKPKFTPNELT
ncbi:hypothetical protein BLOT_011983 [Blomia tropicalis]|nr:hypothetical protein BLOT_011983 [Blomia tropicalis]